MDLFDFMREDTLKREAPLASRLRPEKLDEIVGQRHILGKDKLLYRAIKADKLGSLIFYGPPGTGKTTLAMVIANTTSSVFRQINATSAGKKDMEEVVAEAKQAFAYGKRTILFIDEIHRFNKGQQDYLLPFVEDGTIILIGATTENPYFEVNSALLSRSRIFELKPLEAEDIRTLVYRAVTDPVKGMGSYNAEITEEAASYLADVANGDARAAINAVELGVLTTPPDKDGRIRITLPVAEECIQKRVLRYERNGDNHYDTISAFRGRPLYRAAHHDLRLRGRGKRGPDGHGGGGERCPGGGAGRHAGEPDHSEPGGDLCGLRPEEQRRGQCHHGGDGGGEEQYHSPGACPSAGPALQRS